MKLFSCQGIFSGIWILKIGVKMNFRAITKTYAPDLEKEFPKKSISKSFAKGQSFEAALSPCFYLSFRQPILQCPLFIERISNNIILD